MRMKLDKQKSNQHRFNFFIDRELWEKFKANLPISITPTEKVLELIIDWVREREKIISDKEIKAFQKSIDDELKKIE